MQPRHVGPFEVVRALGSGAQASVFEVRLPSDPRRLALKVLAVPSERARVRFQREGELLARLRHPGIVQVHQAGALPSGHPYLVLPLIDGRSLRDVLREQGPLSLADALTIATQLADALDHAHAQGVVHRDLKPENVLLDGSGQALLTDFGVAWADDLERLTQTGQLAGTPLYMAPEQLEGGGAAGQGVGPAADVHALGALLFELLTGRAAFEPDERGSVFAKVLDEPPPRARRWRADLPHGLDPLLARCMAKAPEARPTAGEVRVALTELEARPGGAARRRLARVALGLGAGAAVVVGALAVGSAFSGLPAAPVSEPSPGASGDPTPSRARPAEQEASSPNPRFGLSIEAGQELRVRISGVRVDRREDRDSGQLRYTLDLACRAEQVDGRRAELVAEVRALAIRNGVGRSALRFDSESPEPGQPPLELIGRPFRVSLDLDSGWVRVQGLEALAQEHTRGLKSLLGGSLRAALLDDALSAQLQAAWQLFPAHPVPARTTWTRELSAAAADFSLRSRESVWEPWRGGRRIRSTFETAAEPGRPAPIARADALWSEGRLLRSVIELHTQAGGGNHLTTDKRWTVEMSSAGPAPAGPLHLDLQPGQRFALETRSELRDRHAGRPDLNTLFQARYVCEVEDVIGVSARASAVLDALAIRFDESSALTRVDRSTPPAAAKGFEAVLGRRFTIELDLASGAAKVRGLSNDASKNLGPVLHSALKLNLDDDELTRVLRFAWHVLPPVDVASGEEWVLDLSEGLPPDSWRPLPPRPTRHARWTPEGDGTRVRSRFQAASGEAHGQHGLTSELLLRDGLPRSAVVESEAELPGGRHWKRRWEVEVEPR